MSITPKRYKYLFKNRDFTVLALTLLFGQFATSFLLLSLVTSIFSLTKSNFSISFLVLTLAVPALFLMSFAGVLADIADRKKVIVISNGILVIVALLLLVFSGHLYISFFLSFCYFGVNSFYLPASSAASSQLVSKSQLYSANSVYVFTLYGGPIIGTFIAAIVNFFFGYWVGLTIAVTLLVASFILPMTLPKLKPDRSKTATFLGTISDIAYGFSYVFRNKSSWFFFFIFAFMNGLIAFGTTLTPGFFDEVYFMPINRSPLFILPLVAFGIFLGAMYLRIERIRQSLICAIGILSIGFVALALGVFLSISNLTYAIGVFPVAIFLVVCGFGAVISMIAARTELQKKVNNKFQGTVFGANTVLATFFATLLSPLAAYLEQWIGYIKILTFGGSGLIVASFLIVFLGRKWKF